MVKSYLYINFNKAIGVSNIERKFKEILWYETILDVADDYVLATFDTEAGGTAQAFLRHIILDNDDWVLSSSYKLLDELGCLDTGFVILGELNEVKDNKVTFYDNVFKSGTDLILNMHEPSDVAYIKSNLRKDRRIKKRSKVKIEGVLHTHLKLDKPLLVQVVGESTDSYVSQLQDLDYFKKYM